MVLRDKEEILLFIRPTAETPAKEQEDVCLLTNCKTIVQTFNAVFENLWSNSTDINERIAELENAEKTPTAPVINDINSSQKTYEEVINSAKKEIIVMTSSDGLIESQKRIALLKEASKKGVSVKVLAPITKEILQAAQDLSKCCSIKNAPIGDLEITVVDEKQLIQSKIQPPYDGKGERIPYFGTYFTTDEQYVKKTRNMIDQIWRNEAVPLVSTSDSIIKNLPTSTSFLKSNKPFQERTSRQESSFLK